MRISLVDLCGSSEKTKGGHLTLNALSESSCLPRTRLIEICLEVGVLVLRLEMNPDRFVLSCLPPPSDGFLGCASIAEHRKLISGVYYIKTLWRFICSFCPTNPGQSKLRILFLEPTGKT